VTLRKDLRRVLAPRSIAVVGVSTNPGGFGGATIERLADFSGPLYRVNPRYAVIGDQPCWPSVSALPEVPDCVVIATGRDMVEPIARECADLGVGGVIIYASGYAEVSGGDGAALQERLTELARTSGMRIVGPNCIGVQNFTLAANITFHSRTMLRDPAPHAIGLVSQSGALGNALTQAVESGMQISHALASGNSCDVDAADLVTFLAGEPSCRAIACLFEGMAKPARMIEAARIAWAAGKPLVIYKIASSQQGAAAALSHTGSLAGSHAAYRAALERHGAVLVDDLEALLETAAFFAKVPPATADGVAVIATSGGASVICADKAEIQGVALPQPGPEAQAILNANIPDFGSARNPCDVTAQVINDPQSLIACIEALFADPVYGALVQANPYASAVTLPRLDVLGTKARAAGKAACWVSFSGWLDGPGLIEAERNPDVALFRSFDRCFAALAAWHWRSARLIAPTEDVPWQADAATRAAVASQISAAGLCLTEREAKAALAHYGLPVVEEALVQSAEEAVAAARRTGYPVAIKVESPDILHKTEAGVLALNLGDAAQLREAYAMVWANALKVAPSERLNGVLVQPMIPQGIELMIGVKVDPLFGPLLVVGFGGILVELLRDTALMPAPVSRGEALGMLTRLKGAALLKGFRGMPAVDLDRLADVIVRAGAFAADHAEAISEVDINPLICAGERIVAVDALILRAEQAAPHNIQDVVET